MLTNARCLTEGVDVPTLDGVAFIDPRRSQVDIVQAVGRAMRKADDKTVGTIVIPVFVDEDADPDEALDSSEFDRVWQVVQALRAHDDVLAEELDELRRELGRRGSLGEKPGKIVLDLPSSVGADFADAFDARLVDQTTASWEYWFGLLRRYVRREETAVVPNDHREDGHALGAWVGNQRRLFQAGDMSQRRAEQLARVPGWVWDAEDAVWGDGFRHLQAFVSEQGTARVPYDFVARDGYRLGAWVQIQRAAYRRGRTGFKSAARVRRHPLEPLRAAQLESLRGWTWEPFVASWEHGFEMLMRFVEREGHARVPARHQEGSFSLGQWTAAQRQAVKKQELSGERKARLEAVPGWMPDPPSEAWEAGFDALRHYVEREGHALVQQGHTEGAFKLGQWVAHQRDRRREGRMMSARAARLEALPGWAWSSYEAAWESRYQLLQNFAAREGHACPENRHRERGFQLGMWVATQRRRHRADELSRERALRLESLPGWRWESSSPNGSPGGGPRRLHRRRAR